MLQIKNSAIKATLIKTDKKLQCQWPRGAANREIKQSASEAWIGEVKREAQEADFRQTVTRNYCTAGCFV